jgi:hypothetical protein
MGLELFAGLGVLPFAVDQHLLVGAVRIGMRRGGNWLYQAHDVILPISVLAIVVAGGIYRFGEAGKEIGPNRRAWEVFAINS